MTEWCLEHPILTFILVFVALDCVRIRILWHRRQKDER